MTKYNQRLKKVESKIHPGKIVVKFLKRPSPSDPVDSQGILPVNTELALGEEFNPEDENVIYVCFVGEEDEPPAR